MKNNIKLPTRNTIRKLILETLSSKKTARKQLIAQVIKKCGFSTEQLKDTGSDSISTRLKSYTGIILNELISEKTILVTEEDYKLVMAESKQLDKKALVETTLKKYLTDDEIKDSSPSGKKNTIKAVMGDIFKRKQTELNKALDVMAFLDTELRKNEAVNNIIREREKCYPDTPLGLALKALAKRYCQCKKGAIKKETYKNEVYKSVLECISLAGGEFFERVCMSLMKACYGTRVIKDELTAGPGDKGIDGIIFVKDEMGFEEKILMQAKTKRRRGYIPLSEIREFLGVMTAEKAEKGILMSNSNYHRETIRFANKVNNFVLIDQKKLLELMEEHALGLICEEGLIRIDEDFFLE